MSQNTDRQIVVYTDGSEYRLAHYGDPGAVYSRPIWTDGYGQEVDEPTGIGTTWTIAGGSGGGGGGAATIADGADVTQGAKADVAATADSGSFSIVALWKRLLERVTTGLASLASILAKLPAVGTAGAASANVITVQGIASGTAQAVSGSVSVTGTAAISAAALPLPSGAATAAKQPALGTAGTASSDVLSVQGIAGGTPQAVAGALVRGSATPFTRPGDTTPYSLGDLVANNTTAGSVVALSITNAARVSGGAFMIRKLAVVKSGTGVSLAAFRVHVFTTAPVVTNGDNAAYLTTLKASWIGAFDVTVDQVFGDGAKGNGVPSYGNEVSGVATGTTIYFLIEARAGYTPANAETFGVDAEILYVN